jgi:hypothetical protein
MNEAKKELSKIILVYDDGSTIELSEDDIMKNHSWLMMALSGFVFGALQLIAMKKKEEP